MKSNYLFALDCRRAYREYSHRQTVAITQEHTKTMTPITWYAWTSLVIVAASKLCKMALRKYKSIAAVANIASVSFQSCQNDFFSLIDIPPFQYFLIRPLYHKS